jgi:acetyltransferase EpsM
MTKIALIGGGGFAKEIDELAELCGHSIIGYFADEWGVLDRPYLGKPGQLRKLESSFDAVCIAFGAVDRKSLARRAALIDWIVAQGLPMVSLVSPHAVRSRGVSIGEGAIVAHGVTLSIDCSIGPFAIVNSNAIIGHDAVVQANTIVAPGAFLGGMAVVGANSLIGPGAIVLEGRTVGSDVIVGLGSTVVRDVVDGATVIPIRSRVRK